MKPINSFPAPSLRSSFRAPPAAALPTTSLAGILGPEPSALVSLSDDAKSFATFAAKGVTVAMRRLDGALGPSVPTRGAAGVAPSTSVSMDDFDRLLNKLGATQEEKNQLKSGLDTDKSGNISRDEFLKGLAATQGTTQDSKTSQALLRLMDRDGNANGVAEAAEFGRFGASFLDAAQHRA